MNQYHGKSCDTITTTTALFGNQV